MEMVAEFFWGMVATVATGWLQQLQPSLLQPSLLIFNINYNFYLMFAKLKIKEYNLT